MKLKILVIKEKWLGVNPNIKEITNSEYHFMNYFTKLDFIDVVTWYYDDEICNYGKETALSNLYNIIMNNKFDAVLLGVYPFDDKYNFQPRQVFELKNIIDVPFIFVWWDSYWPNENVHQNIMGYFDPISALHIYIDSPFYMLNNTNCEFLPNIFDSSLFYKDNSIVRDININFNGNSDSRPLRKNIFDVLSKYGFEVYITGGQSETRLPIEEHVKVYQRSRISLDVTDDTKRLKGRLFETMLCGSLLIEDPNIASQMFFEPNKHYVVYYDECDLIDKIEYYLEHDSEREKIAQAGYERAKELCNGEKYWKHVFNKVGLLV